jgi:hypothetical protein
MKLRYLAAAIVISAGIGAALHAQAQAPGDLNKASHVSRTVKQASHAKKKAHHGASHARVVPVKAGKDNKEAIKKP